MEALETGELVANMWKQLGEQIMFASAHTLSVSHRW